MIHSGQVVVRSGGQPAGGARRLFVIDIENIVGGACNVTDCGAKWARVMLEDEMGMRAGEHAIVAVSAAHALLPAAAAFPGKRHLVRYGASGADLALIEAVDAAHAASRYDEVVIASGDGIFSELAAHLAGYGTRVVAVGHVQGMAAALRLATHETIYFSATYAQDQAVA